MRMLCSWRGLAIGALCATLGGVASASSFSFTGTFNTDDQLQYLEFVAASPSVTIDTLGYGGGTNAASSVIPAGGFAPVLSLFSENGGSTFSPSNLLLDTTFPSGSCSGNTDPGTGACLDVALSESALTTGDTYLVVLTENSNSPVAPTLGDGFTQAGSGDFTGPDFGCPDGSFCDPFGNDRTGNWAVDISGATSAQLAGVPEPETMLPLLIASSAAVLLRRQAKPAK